MCYVYDIHTVVVLHIHKLLLQYRTTVALVRPSAAVRHPGQILVFIIWSACCRLPRLTIRAYDTVVERGMGFSLTKWAKPPNVKGHYYWCIYVRHDNAGSIDSTESVDATLVARGVAFHC